MDSSLDGIHVSERKDPFFHARLKLDVFNSVSRAMEIRGVDEPKSLMEVTKDVYAWVIADR